MRYFRPGQRHHYAKLHRLPGNRSLCSYCSARMLQLTETLLVTTTFVVLCPRMFGLPVAPLSCAITRDGIKNDEVTCSFPQENWERMTMFALLKVNTTNATIICRRQNENKALICAFNKRSGLERRSNDKSYNQTIAIPLEDAQSAEYYCKVTYEDNTNITSPTCKLSQSDHYETVRNESSNHDQASECEDNKLLTIIIIVLCALILLFAVIAAVPKLKKCFEWLHHWFDPQNGPEAADNQNRVDGDGPGEQRQPPGRNAIEDGQGEQLQPLCSNGRGKSSSDVIQEEDTSSAREVTTMMQDTNTHTVSNRRRSVSRPFDTIVTTEFTTSSDYTRIIRRQKNVSEALKCAPNNEKCSKDQMLERCSKDHSNNRTIDVSLQDAQSEEYYCMGSDENNTSIQSPTWKLNQSDHYNTVRYDASNHDQASEGVHNKLLDWMGLCVAILLIVALTAVEVLMMCFKWLHLPDGPEAGGDRQNRRVNADNSSSDDDVTTIMPGTTPQCTVRAMTVASDPSASIRRRSVRRPFDKLTYRSHLIAIINAKPTSFTLAYIFYILLFVGSLMAITPSAQNMTSTQCDVDTSTPAVTCTFPVNIRQQRYDFSLLVQEEKQEHTDMAFSCHWLDQDQNAEIACAGDHGYELLTSVKEISNRTVIKIRKPLGRFCSYSCYVSTGQNTTIKHNCTGEFTQCVAVVKSSDTQITILKCVVGGLALFGAIMLLLVVCFGPWNKRERKKKETQGSNSQNKWMGCLLRLLSCGEHKSSQTYKSSRRESLPPSYDYNLDDTSVKSPPPSYGHSLDDTSSTTATDVLLHAAQSRIENEYDEADDDPYASAIQIHALP